MVELARSVTVAAPDGCPLHGVIWGSAPPQYVCIHGFGDGGYIWRDFMRRSGLTSCLAVDLRGHGDSGWDRAGAYELSTHVSDVEQLTTATGFARGVLIGHSLGAAIGIHIAARNPRISGLVLVDGGPELNASALTGMRERFRSQPWVYPSVAAFRDALAEQLPMAEPAMLEHIAAEALRSFPGKSLELKCDPALASASGSDESELLWRLLRKIRCPVLLIRGARSSILTRATAEKICRETGTVQLHTVPNAGHAVMVENPQDFLAAIRAFLRSISAGDIP